MLQVWIIKSAESTNTCSTSVKIVCTTKVNIKQTFTGNDVLQQIFMW